MTLHEIDQTLARLRNTAESIGTNLVALERDPRRKLLEQASLIGESAARWSEASRALSDLWRWFTRFKEMLEQAAELRGTRARVSADQEAHLAALLSGPSIALGTATDPLGDHDLFGTPAPATHCTPDELMPVMSAAFDRAKAVVVEAAEAWDRFFPRQRSAEAALGELEQLAESPGETAAPEPDELREPLAKLGGLLAKDPLAVRANDFDQVEARLAALRRDFLAAAELRTEAVERFGQAHAMLDQLGDAALAAAEAHGEVTAKITPANVPPPMTLDRAVARQLDRVEALSKKGEWLAAEQELTGWLSLAGGLLHRLRENLAANRTPLQERNQLRGRLDAYRAKAHRLGLTEDPRLSALYRATRDVLYTAPTDLSEAADLLRQYQQAIPVEPPGKVPK